MKNEINPMQREEKSSYPYLRSLRCRATTRQGTTCKAPAVTNKKVCRMHGGAKGSGAPVGSMNALKHGLTTKQTKELKKSIKKLLKECK